MFDDILGPRKKVLNTPVDTVDEKNAIPYDYDDKFADGEEDFEIEGLDLNDLVMDDEADDNDGNTLGDPWGNVGDSNPCNDCDCDDENDCNTCGC